MRRHWKLILFLLIFILVVFAGFYAYQLYISTRSIPDEFPTTGSTTNDNLSSKADASIEELYSKWQEDKDAATSQAQDKGLRIENGRVFVTIKVTDESAASNLIDVINSELGGVTDASYQTIIDAWIPVNSLPTLYSRPEVVLIQNPSEPIRL